MKQIKTFLKAILAGIMINIAATIYLSVEDSVVGALLFTFGLFGVLVTQSNLYTGMAGYFPQRKWWELILVFVGNGVGCIVYSLAYAQTTSYSKIYERVYQLCERKFDAGVLGIFVMSICCGALMFLAVDTFKKNRDIVGVVVVILSVSGFILAGFEHSIANMAYLALAKYPVGIVELGKLLLMGIGNLIGAVGLRKMME